MPLRPHRPGLKAPRLMVSLLAFLWASLALLSSSEAMVCELEEPRNMSILQELSSENSQQSSDESTYEGAYDAPPKVRPQLRRAPSDAGASCQGIFDEECDMGRPDGEPRPSSSLSFDSRPRCLPVSDKPALELSATGISAFTSNGERRPGYAPELFRPPPLR